MAFDCVAGAQPEASDFAWRDINVVRPGEVIGFRRAQEAESVGKDLDHAFADDVDFLSSELLEDREHQLLLAHGAGIFDRVFFSESDEFGRCLGLEVLEFHFPHWGYMSLGAFPAKFLKKNKDLRRCD